jgi:hypothetical protein
MEINLPFVCIDPFLCLSSGTRDPLRQLPHPFGRPPERKSASTFASRHRLTIDCLFLQHTASRPVTCCGKKLLCGCSAKAHLNVHAQICSLLGEYTLNNSARFCMIIMEPGLFTKHRRIHNSAASVSIVCMHAAYIFTLLVRKSAPLTYTSPWRAHLF